MKTPQKGMHVRKHFICNIWLYLLVHGFSRKLCYSLIPIFSDSAYTGYRLSNYFTETASSTFTITCFHSVSSPESKNTQAGGMSGLIGYQQASLFICETLCCVEQSGSAGSLADEIITLSTQGRNGGVQETCGKRLPSSFSITSLEYLQINITVSQEPCSTRQTPSFEHNWDSCLLAATCFCDEAGQLLNTCHPRMAVLAASLAAVPAFRWQYDTFS